MEAIPNNELKKKNTEKINLMYLIVISASLLKAKPLIKKLCQFYKINFGYTQVLFMGSVPRINCLLITVP